MIKEIHYFLRRKLSYFRIFWSYINISIIGCSWGILGVYIWRYQESIRISNLLQETNGYVYINLQVSAYVNDILTFLLGFCCFFGTVKFVRLFRLHPRLSLFTETLQYAAKDLLGFSAMFSFVFMAFLTLFYLLFGDKLRDCSTLLNTAQMLFQMMLMKFSVHQLQDAAPFLGPFCFTLFISLVVFVCMRMFISIIIRSFRIVRDTMKVKQNEDQQVLVYMLRKFKRWTGRRDDEFCFVERIFSIKDWENHMKWN
jgi:hypothetical protein